MNLLSVLYFLLAAIAIYGLICLLMYFFQERFIFFPVSLPDDYPFEEFDNVEERFYDPEPGVRIHALHFKQANLKGMILYFHGNAGAVDGWGMYADDFRALGYEVLMMDYRTYGKSQGPLSESALIADARLLYDDLKRQYKEENIILYGRSLGSGIACKLATLVKPRLLILETPYTSISAMARIQVPIMPTGYLLRYRLRSTKNIKKIQCPVHIFHGTADELIPYRMAKKLTRVYGDPSILTTIPDGLHGNLPEFTQYQEKLKSLLP